MLQNVFGGETVSIRRCKACGATKERTEPIFHLTLEAKNQGSVEAALKKFVAGETVSDYECDACGKRAELENRVALQKLPNTLLVHLQRLVFDLDSLRNIKLNDRIEFPTVLNLKQYTAAEVRKKDEQAAKLEKKKSAAGEQAKAGAPKQAEEGKEDECQELPELESDAKEQEDALASEAVDEASVGSDGENDAGAEQEDDGAFEYKLVGVVCHMGSASAGHYLSYINTDRDREIGEDSAKKPREEWLHPANTKWLEFNDSTVQSFDFRQLDQCCFGGHQN